MTTRAPLNVNRNTIFRRGQATLQSSADDVNKPDGKRQSTANESTGYRNGNPISSNRGDARRHPPSTSSSGSNKSSGNRGRERESFGVIVSIKNTFGFLQPIVGEEQIFFGERDFYNNMKIGDKVAYISKMGNKGPQAENVRFLVPHLEKIITLAKGTIIRNPDRHRSGMGLIEVDLNSIKPEMAALLGGGLSGDKTKREVAYRPNDVLESSIPKHTRLDAGDIVEFSISRVHDSLLSFACNVKLLQLKRDRMVAMQIQRLLDAGAVRELGVVSMVKKGEYGFIKGQDRRADTFFRLDDVIMDEEEEEQVGEEGKVAAEGGGEKEKKTPVISEGMEVDFFVTVEIVKGKMSDRAIHIKPVPRGTVQFEVPLALQVRAVVTEENVTYPQEVPGQVRLVAPVSIEKITGKKGDTISSIELWQRCLPDELVCKVGDELLLDVQYYRPEKLYFARSVVMSSFRKIGREYGVVVSKKEGFGFVFSQQRNMDIYFKSTHVVGADGTILAESAVQTGDYLSFEVSIEDNGRVRAQRVRREDTEATKARIAEATKQIMRKDVLGVVVRNTVKKDSPGLIKIHPSHVTDAQNAEYVNTELVAAVTQFRDCAELTKVSVCGLNASALKQYSAVVDKHFPGIAYESAPSCDSDPGAGKTLTLTKLGIMEYSAWLLANPKAVAKSSASSSGQQVDASGVMTVQFFRDDYESTSFGPLANDLKVVFDLCWDSGKGKKVARSIRLTDEPVPECPERQRGVMEVVVEKEKNEPFGFIRCIPSDEKLFWHCSETYLPYGQDLRTGTDVKFMLRRRGGMRCAVDIEVLAPRANSVEVTLSERCTGIVVESGAVVPVDVSACPLLCNKFVDLRLLQEVTGAERESKSLPASPERTSWEKVKLAPVTEDSAVTIVGEDGSGKTKSVSPFPDMDSIRLDSPVPVLTVGVENKQQKSPVAPSAVSPVPAESEIEYRPKYFSSLPRLATPSTESTAAAEGDVVTFLSVVNWALQRSPIKVANVTKVADAGVMASKHKGRINRLKFRVRTHVKPEYLSEEALSCYALSTVEFVEILLLADSPGASGTESTSPLQLTSTGQYKGQYYYCDAREIRLSSEHSRDLVQQGDEVEFWSTSNTGNLAFGVVLSPKMAHKEIQFGGLKALRPPTVNAELKGLKAKADSSVSIITMAQGPPDDKAHGFAVGWRDAENAAAGLNVSTLPWGHLLAVR